MNVFPQLWPPLSALFRTLDVVLAALVLVAFS
jgi:hypothetical protein